MKFFVAAVFASLALASADVSHLSRTYLPPSQSFSGPNYHHGGVGGGFASGGFGGNFGGGFGGGVGGGFAAPSNQYLPPVQQTLAAPAPSLPGHLEESYVVPSPPSYAGAAVHQSSFSAVGGVGGGFSAPSNEYLPPVQHLSGPSYGGHATANAINAYSSGGSSLGFSSGGADVGTQYAANGGYVYKK